MVTGDSAAPDTLELLRQSKPEFAALYDRHFQADNILNYRPQLAMANALAEWFVLKADLNNTDTSSGRTPPVLAAIDRLDRVAAIGERCMRIEAGLGVITREDLEFYFKCIAETFDRFIPEDRLEAAQNLCGRPSLAEPLGERHPR